MPCPGRDVLEKLMDGALRPDEAAPLREHVRGCKSCQDALRSVADARQAAAEQLAKQVKVAPAGGELIDPRQQIAQAQQAARAVTAPESPAAALRGEHPAPSPEEAPPTKAQQEAPASVDIRARLAALKQAEEHRVSPRQALRGGAAAAGPASARVIDAPGEVTLPPEEAKRMQGPPATTANERAVLPNEGDTREPGGRSKPPADEGIDDKPLSEHTKALPKGQQIGRYVILDQLGVGGMGVVYSAFDPELSRKVALKLLRTAHKRNATHPNEGRARLLREAQAMARISHPNIVTVYDVGSIGEEVYVAMELVEGGTLTDWLKKRRTWREVVQMFRFAGRGLAAAHAAGLVHRDFKPDNVLVANDGRVRVMDFGLARPAVGSGEPTVPPPLADGDDEANGTPDYLLSPLTRAGTIVGTPVYMAPEQFLGEAVDARTDQYAFCVALYEALYGQLPYNAKSVRALAKQALAAKLPKLPPAAGVPIWVHRIVLRGLRPKREDRWPSMTALLGALELATWIRRRLSWAIVTAAAALAGLFWWHPWGYSPDQACAHPEKRFEGMWDAGAKQRVHDAFRNAGLPQAEPAYEAVAQDLDHYVEAWTAARTQACDATLVQKQQSREVLELRLSCLDHRRRELAAFVELLATGDSSALNRAVQAASSLPDLSACSDVAALVRRSRLPADEQDRLRVEELQGKLAQAEAYRASGKYPEAVKLCTLVASAARELRFRPLEADAFLLLGRLLDRSGDYPASEQAFLEAVWAAEAAQLLDVEAEAMIELVTVVGQRQSRHAEGHRWGRHAAAVLEALSDPPKLAADLVDNLGILSRAEGDYEQSLVDHQRALSIREKTLGPDDVGLAGSLQQLGTTYTALGRKEEALACYERALKLMEAQYRAGHPRLSPLLVSLGSALSAVGRNDEAMNAFDRALAADERVFGPEGLSLAPAMNGRARALMLLGRLDEAKAAQERALMLMERGLGAEHPRLATFHITLAEILLRQGDAAASLAEALRADAIRERALGPTHFDVGQSLFHVADAYLHLGKPADAKPLLERALALREGSKAYPEMLAAIRFGLAQALVQTGGDRERARSFAALAEAELASESSPEARGELADVRAWLQRNGGPVVRIEPP